jgi:hypothetical protein
MGFRLICDKKEGIAASPSLLIAGGSSVKLARLIGPTRSRGLIPSGNVQTEEQDGRFWQTVADHTFLSGDLKEARVAKSANSARRDSAPNHDILWSLLFENLATRAHSACFSASTRGRLTGSLENVPQSADRAKNSLEFARRQNASVILLRHESG